MDDAWKQMQDLVDRYSQDWEVRRDIRVVALACERGVRLEIAAGPPDDLGMRHWADTGKRNVSTMRELAQALLDACDFVDEANPTWASHATWAPPK